MLKRVFAVILILCMIVSSSALSFSAFAMEDPAEGYTIIKKVKERDSSSVIYGTDYGSLVFIQFPGIAATSHNVAWTITPEYSGLYDISIECASVKGELGLSIGGVEKSTVYIENPGSTNNQGNKAYRDFGSVNLEAGKSYKFKVYSKTWHSSSNKPIALYNIKLVRKGEMTGAEYSSLVGKDNTGMATSTTAGLYETSFNMMNGAWADVPVNVEKPGYYNISISTACNKDSKNVEISTGGITFKKNILNTNLYAADGTTVKEEGFYGVILRETVFGATYFGKGQQTVRVKVPSANNVRVYRVMLKETTPYLQDNLVFHLDANNNTGDGFDETASQWTDIVSNTKIDVNDNAWCKDSAYQDSYYLDAEGQIKLPENVKEVLSGDEWTIEFMVDSYPESLPEGKVSRNILSLEGEAQESDSFLLCETVDGLKLTAFNQTLDTTVKAIGGVTNAITFDGSKLAVYTQGVENASAVVAEGALLNLDGFDLIFGADDGEFKANIRSIRVYNRALTGSDLIRNNTADRNNYYKGIGADHAHIYDTKYSYDEIAHWYGCAIAGCTSFGENLMDYGEHVFASVDDIDCNICGYKRVTKLIDSYNVDIYEPETDINAAPIVMQMADGDIFDVSNEEKRPSALIFDVKIEDGVLYAYDGETKLGSFIDLYETNKPKANVGVRIYDMETATKLASWVHTERIGNLWVISNDVEILRKVTTPGLVKVVNDTITTVGEPQSYRYVRVENPSKYISATEFDISGIVNGVETDLIHEANGTTVKNGVGISVEGKVVAGKLEYLINGNSNAEVAIDATGSTAWFQIDLGEKQTITNITLTGIDTVTSTSYRYQNFKIMLSDDPEFKENVSVVMSLGSIGFADEPQNFPKYYTVDLSGNGVGYGSEFPLSAFPTSYVRGIIDLTGKTVRGPANVTYDFDANNDNTVSKSEYSTACEMDFEYVTYEAEEGSVYDAMTWEQLNDVIFTCGFRTVLLPESVVTKEEVKFLQDAFVYVFAETDSKTEQKFYDLTVSGVNGILSSDYKTNVAVLESNLFDASGDNIIVRPGAIVAHRGDDDTRAPYSESTLRAFVSAAESGVAALEFDIWPTLDGYLVINHNGSISGFYDYPADYEGERVDAKVEIKSRYWKGDLEHLVSIKDPQDKLPLLHEIYEVVDTEYPDVRLAHEIKWSDFGTVNRIIEHIDRYGMRSRSSMIAVDKLAVQYCNSRGILCQYLDLSGAWGAPVTKDTPNRIYATERLRRPLNDFYTTEVAKTDSAFMEELKHFGVISYPYTYQTQESIEKDYAIGHQGMTVNMVHSTDDFIKELVPTLDSETGKISVKAHTLSELTAEGTFDENSLTVDKWWVDSGVSTGISVYDLEDFEIFAVAGTPEIDNENKTVSGEPGDAVAVRYKQVLDNSSFYVYSNALEFAVDNAPVVVKNDNSNTFAITNYSEELTYEFAYGSETAPEGEWQTVASSTITATKPEKYIWVRTLEGDAVRADKMSEAVALIGTRLVLDGAIGLKIEYEYTDNASDIIAEASFVKSGEVISQGTYAGNSRGYIILPFAPKDVNTSYYTATLSYTHSEKGSVEFEELSKLCVSDMIARYKELEGEEYEEVRPLIIALENYCNYADSYFNGTQRDALVFTESEIKAMSNIADPVLAKGNTIGNLKFYSTSLILEDRITLRHYFKMTGDINLLEYVVTGGSELGISENNSEYAYVDIADISAEKLGQQKEIKITFGQEELTVTFAPLNYVKFTYNSENVSQRNLVCALYRYYKEAYNYADDNSVIVPGDDETEDKEW